MAQTKDGLTVTFTFRRKNYNGYAIVQALNNAVETMKDAGYIRELSKLQDAIEAVIEQQTEQDTKTSVIADIKRDVKYINERLEQIS